MKKAQLTLMIITGIVLLFAVGMVILIGSKTETKRTEPAAEQQRMRQAAVQPVKDYIQNCLDITTMSALDFIGKQGGVIYKSQGGLTPDVDKVADLGKRYVEYNGYNVSYLIQKPAQDIGRLYFANPPSYPWPSFPHVFNSTDSSITKTMYTGYFGKSLLPPLLKPGENSIQEQLELYIKFNLPKCTDWSTFSNQGLSIAAGKPNITVLIAENKTQIETEQYFSVIADWPVTITDLTTGGNTTLDEFSLSHPVHLAKFYLFIQGLILSEINDASFNPLTAGAYATPVYIEKDVFANPETKETDDIIIAQDTESMMRGKPLEFWILRDNRYPALVWVNQTGLDEYVFYPMGTCKDKASISISGNLLSITYAESPSAEWSTLLEAVDPDEDVVAFRRTPDDGKIGKYGQPPPVGSENRYRMHVYASDGGEIEDEQELMLTLTGCPQE
jgi:hypothetical protein